MRKRRPIRARVTEEGVALLISIFILLLISVVAIALIVASGTESALAGNYRSSTGVYYAALAGLEEARGRLSLKNPNPLQNAAPGFFPTPGNTLALGNVLYVLNPGPADNLATMLATYPDNEYATEFGAPPNPGNVTPISSVWNMPPLNGLGVPGPLYKWVRINAVSEQSLGLDTSPYDGTIDPTAVYYDGTNLNDRNNGQQVLEITSLAVLPNGSEKMVQYLVAPTPLNLSFNAALTLDGNTPEFTASPSSSYWVKGSDQGSNGTCNPIAPPVAAVGYSSGSLSNFVQPSNPSCIPAGLQNNYTNGLASNPDISLVTLSVNLQTVAGLNSLVQTISQNADAVVNGPVTQSGTSNIMPPGMSATNPMTVVVNGDLTFNGWRNTGYGLLLVTGKLTYDPDASWDGIILVIGQGWMYSHQGAYTTTQIQGAVFLARTLDASGNPLPPSSPPAFTPPPGSPSGFDFYSTPNTLTNGIYYSNCWIQAAMPNLGYQVLSFHEISQ